MTMVGSEPICRVMLERFLSLIVGTGRTVVGGSAPEEERWQENRGAWVAALRSGEYKQGMGLLFDGDAYDCFGVLCVVSGMRPRKLGDSWYFGPEDEFAPPQAMAFVGLTDKIGSYAGGSLDALDARGASFADIADIIDSEPEGLFLTGNRNQRG